MYTSVEQYCRAVTEQELARLSRRLTPAQLDVVEDVIDHVVETLVLDRLATVPPEQQRLVHALFCS